MSITGSIIGARSSKGSSPSKFSSCSTPTRNSKQIKQLASNERREGFGRFLCFEFEYIRGARAGLRPGNWHVSCVRPPPFFSAPSSIRLIGTPAELSAPSFLLLLVSSKFKTHRARPTLPRGSLSVELYALRTVPASKSAPSPKQRGVGYCLWSV